jgi:hypothetical protein
MSRWVTLALLPPDRSEQNFFLEGLIDASPAVSAEERHNSTVAASTTVMPWAVTLSCGQGLHLHWRLSPPLMT